MSVLSVLLQSSAATGTVNSATQTDTELLEYIGSQETALKTTKQEITLLHMEIALLHKDIDTLKAERSRYRYMWMAERKYCSKLIEAGAETPGGHSQVRDSEGSSPYYRRKLHAPHQSILISSNTFRKLTRVRVRVGRGTSLVLPHSTASCFKEHEATISSPLVGGKLVSLWPVLGYSASKPIKSRRLYFF